MDIKCATCQEPWEHYHLREDLIWDIWDGEDDSSSHVLCKKFLADPQRTLTPMIRADLEEAGWKFGSTIYSIHRCACCPDESELSDEEKASIAERIELRSVAEELLGDDHDGLISTMTDVDRYQNMEEL